MLFRKYHRVVNLFFFFFFLPGMMFDMHTVTVGYSVFLSHMIFTLLQHLSLDTPIAKIFYQLWSHVLSI